MKKRSENSDELRAIGLDFVHTLSPRKSATIVALSGDLGAGKTNFTQGVAEGLGVSETVSSPTFVIEKVYELTDQRFSHLIHIDAYRLKDESELETLGWERIAQDPGNIIVIEWPERVPALIPNDSIRIRFDIDNDARMIFIDGREENSS